MKPLPGIVDRVGVVDEPGAGDIGLQAVYNPDLFDAGRIVLVDDASGVASRPRRTRSKRYPSACPGKVFSQSKCETSRLRAFSSAVHWRMGS